MNGSMNQKKTAPDLVRSFSLDKNKLISVMLWFVRPLYLDSDVIGLLIAKFCEFCPQLIKVQTSYFFVKLLAETKNTDSSIWIVTDVDLSDGLVCKTIGHDETWMPRCTTKVD